MALTIQALQFRHWLRYVFFWFKQMLLCLCSWTFFPQIETGWNSSYVLFGAGRERQTECLLLWPLWKRENCLLVNDPVSARSVLCSWFTSLHWSPHSFCLKWALTQIIVRPSESGDCLCFHSYALGCWDSVCLLSISDAWRLTGRLF